MSTLSLDKIIRYYADTYSHTSDEEGILAGLLNDLRDYQKQVANQRVCECGNRSTKQLQASRSTGYYFAEADER